VRQLAESPAHRINLLARDVGKLGVGVVIDRSRETPTLLVTQLFAKLALPFHSKTALRDALSIINNARQKNGLKALKISNKLAGAAQRHLQRKQDGMEKQTAGEKLNHDLLALRSKHTLSVMTVQVGAMETLASVAPLTKKASMLAVGIAVGKVAGQITLIAVLALPK
jgi:hypothetical protein